MSNSYRMYRNKYSELNKYAYSNLLDNYIEMRKQAFIGAALKMGLKFLPKMGKGIGNMAKSFAKSNVGQKLIGGVKDFAKSQLTWENGANLAMAASNLFLPGNPVGAYGLQALGTNLALGATSTISNMAGLNNNEGATSVTSDTNSGQNTTQPNTSVTSNTNSGQYGMAGGCSFDGLNVTASYKPQVLDRYIDLYKKKAYFKKYGLDISVHGNNESPYSFNNNHNHSTDQFSVGNNNNKHTQQNPQPQPQPLPDNGQYSPTETYGGSSGKNIVENVKGRLPQYYNMFATTVKGLIPQGLNYLPTAIATYAQHADAAKQYRQQAEMLTRQNTMPGNGYGTTGKGQRSGFSLNE